jgi:hypothetical protein
VLRKLEITAPDRQVTMRLPTLLSLVLSWMSPAFGGMPPATHGSSIAHDGSGAAWTIANGSVEWQVSGDPGTRDAGLVGVRVGAAPAWPIATGADALFKIDGRTREIGRARDGFTVDRVSVLHVANGVQLDVAMRLTDVRIAVTRHYVLFDDSPVLDLWTTVQSFDSRAQALSDVNGCSVAVPAGTPLAQRAAGGQRRRLARPRVYDAGPGAELPWSNDSLLRFRVVLVKRHAVHVHTQVSGHSITRETTRSSRGALIRF